MPKFKSALISTMMHCYGCKTTFESTPDPKLTGMDKDAPLVTLVWRVVCMGCLMGTGLSVNEWMYVFPGKDATMLTIGHGIRDSSEVMFVDPCTCITTNDVMSTIPTNATIRPVMMSMPMRTIGEFVTNRAVVRSESTGLTTTMDTKEIGLEPEYVNVITTSKTKSGVMQISM